MKNNLLSLLIHEKARELGKEDALLKRNDLTKEWESVSWNTFSDQIKKTAYALCDRGITPKNNIGIYSPNRIECFYTEFAIFANRAVSVPLYETASLSNIQYIIEEADIEILFVGKQFQYDNAYKLIESNSSLKQLILFDRGIKKVPDDRSSVYFDDFISIHSSDACKQEVEERMNTAQEDDIVHLIYTSGTTGEPKGVILKHSNYMEVIRIHNIRLDYLPAKFLSMCLLPLTHIFEKAWSVFCLSRGCTLAVNEDPREIQSTLKEVKPNAMCTVPRFWEKIYIAVNKKIDDSSPLMKRVFRDAVKTGKIHNLDYKNKGKKAPWGIQTKFNFYKKTVYKLLHKTIGIENGIVFPCAGAMLSDHINELMQSVNIPLVYGYGLTETSATVTCFPEIGFKIGTVGKIMPDVEVRMGENNEIQVRGKTVMHGYYKKPEETKKALAADGWFRTGDAGKITDENEIILTDRIKDLYKTSNGKYIAPQQIEVKLTEDKFIEMAAVIGDQRKYATALIVPSFEELKTYAKEKDINYIDMNDLLLNPAIRQIIEERINKIQQVFSGYEQIKKFKLLEKPFSIESGELTTTLKLKRPFIAEKFKNEIESMYKED